MMKKKLKLSLLFLSSLLLLAGCSLPVSLQLLMITLLPLQVGLLQKRRF